MKNLCAWLMAGLFYALLSGCDSDDPEIPAPEPVVSFTAFSGTGGDLIQISGRSDSREPTVIGLTEELNLQFLEEVSLQIDSRSIAYYTWELQESRAYYKDLESGDIYFAEDLCGFRTENDFPQVIRSVGGNRDFVVMVYTALPLFASPETRVRILRKQTGLCEDLLLPGAGQNGVSDFLMNDRTLALTFAADFTEAASMALIDLDNASLLTVLPLKEDYKAAAFRQDELLIFSRGQTYETFNTQTLQVTGSGPTPGLPLLDPGFFTARFSGGLMEVRYIYQQPSLFFAQPAIYDLETQNLVEGGEPFLPLLQNRIEQETGNRVLFGNFDVDLEFGLILITYVTGDGSPTGGLVLTNFNAEPLEVIELPFPPQRVVLQGVIQP